MEIARSGLQTRKKVRQHRVDYNAAVATEVRVAAARLDVSHTALGEALGIDQSGMSRRMSGQTPFRADELAAIAELVGCSVADLLPKAYDGNPVDELRAKNNKMPLARPERFELPTF